jgi:uncharacterized protein YcnI
MRTSLMRVGAALVGGVAAVALVVTPAAAHVTVNPSTATQGGFAKLTFRVPNERDNATTTTIEVNLPADQPIASVSVKPTVGWTATVTTTKLATPIKSDDGDVTDAVSKIVWKADTAATAIQVGQFQEFDVSAGPLPKVDKLVFKVLQTYSDGDVVRWIDLPAGDGTEPDHPAPTLTLAKAAAGDAGNAPPAAAPAAPKATGDNTGRANLALGFGIAALVIALGSLALAWRRRPPTV